jgi:nicotinamide mononucleotide transporter
MPLADLLASVRRLPAAESAAVLLAIAYLVLAIRQNILCWLAAFLSSLIYLAVFFGAQLYMESALQVFYAAMAIYGYIEWKYGGAEHTGVHIKTWPVRAHAAALAFIAVASLALGWLLSHTNAAFPFADSFTSVAAIVTTYMVARKILENWGYWFVIDSVSVYLYLARGLELTAALFVLYLVLIVVGFRRWWLDWRAA